MPYATSILRVVGFALLAFVFSACNPGTPANAPVDDSVPRAAASVTMTVDAKGYIPFDTAAGIPWKAGMTVGDAVRATQDIAFGIKEYADLGRLVNAVNGLENNTHDGHYWQFCVDGVFSEVGMDEKALAAGQTVNWYYRAYGEGPCKKIGE